MIVANLGNQKEVFRRHFSLGRLGMYWEYPYVRNAKIFCHFQLTKTITFLPASVCEKSFKSKGNVDKKLLFTMRSFNHVFLMKGISLYIPVFIYFFLQCKYLSWVSTCTSLTTTQDNKSRVSILLYVMYKDHVCEFLRVVNRNIVFCIAQIFIRIHNLLCFSLDIRQYTIYVGVVVLNMLHISFSFK